MKSLAGWAFLGIALILLSFRTMYSIEAVTTAIRAGNVNQLSPYLDYRVDITLEDKSDTYSKTQAEMVIRDFFSNAGIRNFEVKQKGEKGGYLYCTGILKTSNGNYYTSLFLKKKGDRDLLQEIRFEK